MLLTHPSDCQSVSSIMWHALKKSALMYHHIHIWVLEYYVVYVFPILGLEKPQDDQRWTVESRDSCAEKLQVLNIR